MGDSLQVPLPIFSRETFIGTQPSSYFVAIQQLDLPTSLGKGRLDYLRDSRLSRAGQPSEPHNVTICCQLGQARSREFRCSPPHVIWYRNSEEVEDRRCDVFRVHSRDLATPVALRIVIEEETLHRMN